MVAILSTYGLSRRFGAVVAADDISVDIGPGEIVGIIGTNGAGKTTFVNLVTGYTKPSAGRIELAGKDITGLSPIDVVRRGVGRSFQIAQMFSGLTCEENLLMAIGVFHQNRSGGLQQFGSPEAQALCARTLEEYDIAGYRHVPVTAMPQGARKLLDIAMATVSQPRLLLLDEPTSGVSSQEKFSIMDCVLGTISRATSSVLLIEHDMDIVRRYTDRVLAFAQGKIIKDGPPEAVLVDEQVRALIVGSSNA